MEDSAEKKMEKQSSIKDLSFEKFAIQLESLEKGYSITLCVLQLDHDFEGQPRFGMLLSNHAGRQLKWVVLEKSQEKQNESCRNWKF